METMTTTCGPIPGCCILTHTHIVKLSWGNVEPQVADHEDQSPGFIPNTRTRRVIPYGTSGASARCSRFFCVRAQAHGQQRHWVQPGAAHLVLPQKGHEAQLQASANQNDGRPTKKRSIALCRKKTNLKQSTGPPTNSGQRGGGGSGA